MQSIEKILYTARVHTRGGRDGEARSDDGRLQVRLTPPGAPGEGSNPEQLFAAGWSACFIGALRHAANARKQEFPADTTVDAEVELMHGEQGFFLRAHLAVHLPGLDAELAQRLLDAAQQSCPYSKALRGNVAVTLSLC
ncbi:organic hydroperoxide resistance protein [Pseudomonas sp. BGr12]|uniref:organic hydroperoxide resistance protein n=1 Tax=unclassified Pseudomonas TaxID=196821 RepID=UPI001784EB54|nr:MULTISPECIES: organic hydroperoxide resistance protein [unclassified Pseudomonas]MBD9504234.1 organic hydroperoxide resistance protein [Pseudomonas sp. PDM17]MBD9578723.1 organic hydroperoxide resistance protein [Pseudomonas sp. PDM23]MBD9674047.1 organic hydroperoxide resistance protein [Pseudomonas sp. PDM21]MDL2429918.1 organic hydroperoxide resistance protein [Pseudomonas sp. BJa5]